MQNDLITVEQAILIMQTRLESRVSRSTFYRYIKTKSFPENIGVGIPRLWNRRAVEEWCDNRKLTGRAS